MKKLADIMRPGFLISISRDATVSEAVQAMVATNVGIVAVLEGDRLLGLVSERDVVRRVVYKGLDPKTTLVEEVMTTNVVVGDADEDFASAMKKMDQGGMRHLPVVGSGRLLSMISIRDLMRAEIRERREEVRFLHEYMQHVPADLAATG